MGKSWKNMLELLYSVFQVCCAAVSSDHTCVVNRLSKLLYICSECGCPAETLEALAQHVGTCAGGLSKQKLKCARCPESMPSIKGFWKHFVEQHWNKQPGYLAFSIKRGNENVRVILCLPCGSILPSSMQAVHLKSCHSENPQVTCPDAKCPYPTTTATLALHHYRDVHWEAKDGAQFICQTCGHLSISPQKCCRTPKWLPLCSYCGEDFDDHGEGYQKHRNTCLGAMSLSTTEVGYVTQGAY